HVFFWTPKHKQEKEACIDLMERKTILLCLFVLLLLGNSTHAEMCEVHVPYSGIICIELGCQNACRDSWGDHTKKAYCVPVNASLWSCHCIVCND
uniref:Knottin scorpion toxin-like domain-containing protein n=1 Tax=Aegilops tauschii subsp. strangulata TaxID=200361 RepID=A0A452XBW3_AEGTS